MRLIPDDGDNIPTLPQLGFLPEQIKLIMQILRMPEGMTLLTGPTGSGKSATLRVFSDIWLKLTGGKKRLLTLENPPEGVFPVVFRPPLCLKTIHRRPSAAPGVTKRLCTSSRSGCHPERRNP
jgi:Tfp pilus assembly ATPase PilU